MVAFVDSATASPGSVSSFTITHSPTNGNCLVIVVSLATTTVSVSSITDNGSGGGSSYYFRNAVNNSTNVRCEIWSTTHNGVSGSPTTITVNLSGASQVNAISAQYSGVGGFGGSQVHTGSGTAATIVGATAQAHGFVAVGVAGLGTATYSSQSGTFRTSTTGTTVGAALEDNTSATAGATITTGVSQSTGQQFSAVSLNLVPSALGTAGGSLVQGSAGLTPTFGSGSNMLTVPFETPNSAGNLIVVGVSGATSTSTFTIADTLGQGYSSAIGPITDGGAGFRCQIFYFPNSAAGTNSVTVTSSTTGRLRVFVHEYSGVALSSPLDQTSSGTGNSTALASGSKTPTQNGELIFGFGAIASSSTWTAGASFTKHVEIPTASSNSAASEDLVQATAASINAQMTAGTTGQWIMLLATFKAPPSFSPDEDFWWGSRPYPVQIEPNISVW